MALVERLRAHPMVFAVHYPGCEHTDPTGLVGRQMHGPGSVLAFDVGSREIARTIMGSLRLITPAVSLGSVDTLIQHPASLTHRVVEDDAKSASGVSAGLLRLSVGIEEPDSLWRDLSQAFEQWVPALAAR